MIAYYNEHDKFAAAWLRELIADGLIAPGEVDERSIEDVRPDELSGFVQCHFFAGIGVWSLALRQAGWPDDEPIWTGSCPCQPFSAAGKGTGFDDERHLWPAFHWLIEQSGAPVVLGEQVASQDGLAWLNLVSADLEATGYAFGAVDTCAAGFGAPHIRQRLYWMADATSELDNGRGSGGPRRRLEHSNRSDPGRLANADDTRLALGSREANRRGAIRQQGQADAARGLHDRLADSDGGNAGTEGLQRSGEQRQQPQDGGAGGMDDAPGSRHERAIGEPEGLARHEARLRLSDAGRESGRVGNANWANLRGKPGASAGAQEGPSVRAVSDRTVASGQDGRPGPLNGLWRDADWLCCTDGKWRPVAPGTFPLAPTGTVRNRVGQLRGAGNAINLAQAQGFIEAVMDIRSQANRQAA